MVRVIEDSLEALPSSADGLAVVQAWRSQPAPPGAAGASGDYASAAAAGAAWADGEAAAAAADGAMQTE